MGRCIICGSDMGYFRGRGWGVDYCSDKCEKEVEKRKIYYGDKIKVISGFYKGQEGVVSGSYRCIGVDDYAIFAKSYGYPVKLKDGNIQLICQSHIEKILKG